MGIMTYIVIMLIYPIIAVGAFVAGFYMAGYFYTKQGLLATRARTENKRAIAEITGEQRRNMLKRQIELQNFMNYNGDPLPKPEDIID
jgi:hypothetical protein